MLLRLALGLVLLLSFGATQEARGAWVIPHDHGGPMWDYIVKYDRLRAQDRSVAIESDCASACTMVLGAVPREKICVTPWARLGFHQAYSVSQASAKSPAKRVASKSGTDILMLLYPPEIHQWLKKKGGLPHPNKMVWLEGAELQAIYRLCPQGIANEH